MRSESSKLENLSARFHNFSESEAKGSSPLYAFLAAKIAEDPELLEVAAWAPKEQPTPNLLFASVQYLLRQGGQFIASEDAEDDAYRLLREIVLGRKPEVTHLLSTRLVQTNEPRRSIYLLPSLARICGFFPEREIGLLEIGASAGLNLLFDQYKYQFDVALLPSLLKRLPEETVPVVYHTHVANQLPHASKDALLRELDLQGRSRDIVHLHNNIEPHLHATIYKNGQKWEIPLANADGHARWVEWLDDWAGSTT